MIIVLSRYHLLFCKWKIFKISQLKAGPTCAMNTKYSTRSLV